MSDARVGDGFVVPDWPAPRNVRAIVTTRAWPGASKPPFDRFNLGMRCGDDAAAVAANRAALVERLDLPEAPRWLRQVHGVGVHDADTAAVDPEPEADASVTHRAGRVLAILTADCLPVFLASEDGSTVGLAHAGWRGLAAGVIEATLAALAVPPASLVASLLRSAPVRTKWATKYARRSSASIRAMRMRFRRRGLAIGIAIFTRSPARVSRTPASRALPAADSIRSRTSASIRIAAIARPAASRASSGSSPHASRRMHRRRRIRRRGSAWRCSRHLRAWATREIEGARFALWR
jgi:hypothetical protein